MSVRELVLFADKKRTGQSSQLDCIREIVKCYLEYFYGMYFPT